jgi:hypothetical protein
MTHCIHCGVDNGRHNGACPERFTADIAQIKADRKGICARVAVLENPRREDQRKLQKDAAKLIQQVIDDWGPMPAEDGPGAVRYHEYKEAHNRWLFGPGALDVAWGLLANAYNGDWSKCARSWQVSARDWEQRWHAFEKTRFSTPVVQAAVIAGQGEQLQHIRALFGIPGEVVTLDFLKGFYDSFRVNKSEAEKMIAAQDAQTKAVMRERDLLKNEVERLTSALETERAVNKRLIELRP